MSDPPLVAILAAGRATRFGGGKLDADCGGHRVGAWVVEAVRAAGAAPGIIVTGTEPAVFAREATAQGWILVENGKAGQGIATSVALAATHAATLGASALVVLLADMPLVTPGMITALLHHPAPVSATRHGNGQPGAPARFPPALFEPLAGLSGDAGAMALLRGLDRRTIGLVEPARDALIDVDDPAALSLASAVLAARRDGKPPLPLAPTR